MVKIRMRFIVMMIVSVFSLNACGFTPVYAPKNMSHLNQVNIAVIPERSGQSVRNHLIDMMYQDGYPANPQYQLNVAKIDEEIIGIGIDKDDTASRAQLRQSATFTLTRLSNGDEVLKRTVRATTGYNILAGQFTTFVTEEDARNQAQRALADNIMTQLELYFNRMK